MRPRNLSAGEFLIQQGDNTAIEVIVFRGVIVSGATDSEGNDTTFNFFVGLGVVRPAITRFINGESRVHLKALTVARVISFPDKVLNEAMLKDRAVQKLGESVLRSDLITRADREWALAVLSGKQRLQKFRQDFPGLEEIIPHQIIASYLGLTPVSFGRLRK